jgi:hypothetical protein
MLASGLADAYKRKCWKAHQKVLSVVSSQGSANVKLPWDITSHSSTTAMLWIWHISKGPYVKGLVPSLVLLGRAGNFKKWGLLGDLLVLGHIPLSSSFFHFQVINFKSALLYQTSPPWCATTGLKATEPRDYGWSYLKPFPFVSLLP